jgi:hypothetical protein
LRLLLDEHFPVDLARALRERGHEVEAVVERTDLREGSDARILEAAVGERRPVVTEDVADYMRLFRFAQVEGPRHFGMVFARRFSRRKPALGALIEAVDAFLRDRPGDDELVDRVHWLERR